MNDIQSIINDVTELIKERNFDEAAAQLVKALRKHDSESSLHALFGKVLFELGSYEESIRQLQIAVDIAPQYHYYWNWLGSSLAKVKRLDEAEAAQRKALEIEPNDFLSLMGLGLVLTHLKRNDEAEEVYLAAYIKRPDNPDCLSLIGSLAMAKGKFSEAEGWFRKALEANPDHVLSRGLLSVVLQMMSRDEESNEEMGKFEKLVGKKVEDE
jgi:superkiller protein 3